MSCRRAPPAPTAGSDPGKPVTHMLVARTFGRHYRHVVRSAKFYRESAAFMRQLARDVLADTLRESCLKSAEQYEQLAKSVTERSPATCIHISRTASADRSTREMHAPVSRGWGASTGIPGIAKRQRHNWASSRPCLFCGGLMRYDRTWITWLTGRYVRHCAKCGYIDPTYMKF